MQKLGQKLANHVRGMGDQSQEHEPELTHQEKKSILKHVILGACPPADESEAARVWREKCERDVAANSAMGFMTEIPDD